MLTILLHTSKTMRSVSDGESTTSQHPAYVAEANLLANQLKKFSPVEIQKAMNISPDMAEKTVQLIKSYTPGGQTIPAIDAFLGDIYSGLQAQTFTPQDRTYANRQLYILSGMYGVLRPLDGIQPYRLEMGYKLPTIPSLYSFWGDKVAKQLPKGRPIINLSAVEYTKAVLPHLKNIEGMENVPIISPKFLTFNETKNEAIFVTVHTKIARGAFARWMIQNRVEKVADLKSFSELGYKFNEAASTEAEPVYIARKFEGLGLSVRLS